MEIKTSVFKRSSRTKKGLSGEGVSKSIKVRGGWVYRIRYVDQDGRPRCAERGFYDLKAKAKDAMNAHVMELTKSYGHSRTGERMTFNQLADRCEKEFYGPAVISNGKKIAGIRSSVSVVGHIKNLRNYFGSRLIGSITTDSLFAYRVSRLKPQPSKKPGGKDRTLTIATANRELAAMRRMMRYAHANGWVTRDIFYNSKVIQTALEEPRNRILTRVEEARLLASCEGEWTVPYTRVRKGKEEHLTATFNLDNRHLRGMIILALDTGMRRGEIVKMRWTDIDFDGGFVRIMSSHTKTERERIVPLTERSKEALANIRPLSQGDRPFPSANIKRAFATAKRLAGIEDLRFHDLRATAGDRMARVYPLSTVAKILGHTQLQTTMKHYVGNELDSVIEVKRWLDGQLNDLSDLTLIDIDQAVS